MPKTKHSMNCSKCECIKFIKRQMFQNRRQRKTNKQTKISCLQGTLLQHNNIESLIIMDGKKFTNEMLKESKQKGIIHIR